jgi:hypothetical protein
MNSRSLACVFMLAGCADDEPSVSSAAQAVSARDVVHTRNTGVAAEMVASGEDGFQSIYLARDIVATVPAPLILAFGATPV